METIGNIFLIIISLRDELSDRSKRVFRYDMAPMSISNPEPPKP